MTPMPLHRYFVEAASRFPDQIAVRELSGLSVTYRDLDLVSDRLRDRLRMIGIARGDRVGISLHKSIDSVACILGILKCGAAYVPVDAGAPPGRSAFIFHDSSVKAVIAETSLAGPLTEALAGLGGVPSIIALEGVGGGGPLRHRLDAEDSRSRAPSGPNEESGPDDLAYILYTSGSTGKPKGVMLSHLNAKRFVDWCSETFEPLAGDRLSCDGNFVLYV